jgi:CBS domain-containing protein
MKAREIMTSAPEVLLPDDTVGEAAGTMARMNVGALPVVEDRSGMRLVGVVTDRDLVVRHVAEGHGEDCAVRHHMTERGEPSEFATVRPEDTVEYVMELMSRHQIRRVPVLDRTDERLVGIVALADVAREVGPVEPAEVVKVLRDISEPVQDLTPAPTG